MALNPLNTIYKEINGSKITSDLYLPQCDSTSPQRFPVVINIHGGAFMLGHSRMVSLSQIDDCLSRGWIVLVPNHRLCPGANLLDGPIQDIRDLLTWIQSGSLNSFLSNLSPHRADLDNIAAFGTSSGGTLALSLGFDVPVPVKAILSLYGPVNFTDPFWTTPLPEVAAKLPPDLSPSFLQKVYSEFPIPTDSSVSLEGQSESGGSGPNFTRPRDAFAFTQIASGTVLNAIYPQAEEDDPGFERVDPINNVTSAFPPTYIVHGQEDRMVPINLSRAFFAKLNGEGVRCGMTEVPGEGHTFAATMEVGSQTWELQREGFNFLEGLIGQG